MNRTVLLRFAPAGLLLLALPACSNYAKIYGCVYKVSAGTPAGAVAAPGLEPVTSEGDPLEGARVEIVYPGGMPGERTRVTFHDGKFEIRYNHSWWPFNTHIDVVARHPDYMDSAIHLALTHSCFRQGSISAYDNKNQRLLFYLVPAAAGGP